MRSLITGGAGFIGSHVARHCLNIGQEVIVLDDLTGGFRENIPDGATFVEGSVTDRDLVNNLFASNEFDYVYHLAAYAAEGLSHFIRTYNYTTNLIGSTNLINQAIIHGTKCFVFTSSIAVYGKGQNPISEEQVPKPEDPYGISKYAVEMDLKCANEMFGLNYIVFRPHNVYGAHQNIGDKYRNVVGIFMNQVMSGEPMTVFGDGSQTRAFSYIDDVAPMISRSVVIADAYNDTFNVGADVPHTVLEVAHAVAESFGVVPDLKFLPARNEVEHAYSSHEKIRRVFGLGEGISLRDGIGRMTDWALQRGAQKTSPFTHIEVTKNMPPSWAKELS